MTQRVPVVAPDGTPGTVPADEVQPGMRVLSPQEAASAKSDAEQEERIRNQPFDPAETWLAAAHANFRGVGEAVGVPVDPAITGIADLFGKKEQARAYLRGIEERHPLASGWMGMMGNVSGAMGAATALGAPGAIGGASIRGIGGVAARAAYGGAENVVAATTRDINEASLGNLDTNAQKLFAAAPKHFVVGAGLTAGLEGLGAAAATGLQAAARKGAPALERGATAALGREVGEVGEEGLAAGARIRDLGQRHLGRMPHSASELTGVLESEQRALRGEAEKAYAGKVSALEGEQAGEIASLEARHARGLEGVENMGRMRESAARYDRGLAPEMGAERVARSVEEAEGQAASGELHAAREGYEGVRAAEAEGAKGIEEAHAGAFEKRLGQFDAEARARPDSVQFQAAVRQAQDDVDRVALHYDTLARQVAAEREAAALNANKIYAEWEANAEAYKKLLGPARAEGLGTPMREGEARFAADYERNLAGPLRKRLEGQVASREAAGIGDDQMVAMGLKMAPGGGRGIDRSTESATAKLYDNVFGEGAAMARKGPSAAEQLERIKALGADLKAAHGEALKHLSGVDAVQRKLAEEAQRETAAAARRYDQTIARFQRGASEEAVTASKAAEQAMAKVRAAEAEVSHLVDRARAAAAEKIEKARSVGTKAAEKVRQKALKEAGEAEKRAMARVEIARAEAAAAKKQYQAIVARDTKALEKAHGKALKAIPKPGEETSVDAMLAGAKMRAKENELRPMVSGAAMVGAGLSLAHGHPAAALTALGTSFAAGRMRAHGNFLAARAMSELSKKLTAMDQAIERGAAGIVSGVGSKGAMAGERLAEAETSEQPKFDDVAAQVMAAKSNPALIEYHVRQALGPAADHAPMLYAATLVTAHKAQAYLESILPPPPIDPGTLTPHLQEADISPTEKDAFMDAYDALSNPTDLFRQIKTGELTEQKVEAVRAVMPNVLGQMAGETMNWVSKLKEPLDYEREIQIGLLLGQQTNEVLSPGFQAAQSQAFDDKSAGKPVGSKPRSGESQLAKDTQSAAEKVEKGQP